MVRRKSGWERIEKAHPEWVDDVFRIVGPEVINGLLEKADESGQKGSRKQMLYRVKQLHMPSCNRLWGELSRMGYILPPPEDAIVDELDWIAITTARELRGLMGDEDFRLRIDADKGQLVTLRALSHTKRSLRPRKQPP